MDTPKEETPGEAGSGKRASGELSDAEAVPSNAFSLPASRVPASRPWPLLVGFGIFVVAMIYLVAASLTRRVAPTFAPTTEARGDTLTVDATDGAAWRYVSLERGRVLTASDTSSWDLAVRRYNVRVRGRGEIGKWYRYSLLTHLLEPKPQVYVVEPVGGRAFEVTIVSYYCPGLTAGCLTMRYVPFARGS